MKTAGNIEDKRVSVGRVLELIKPGNRVFLSSGPSIPALTVRAIVESDRKNLLDLEIIQLITLGDYLPSDARQSFKYRLKTFNIGESIIRDISDGKVDFIPANLMEIPLILSSGAVGVDIAIVQTSPPDRRGFLNLGVAVDVANIAIKNADLVVAEINPAVPVTYGETSIHMNQVDYMVESTVPLLERERAPYDPAMERIGWHVSNIIDGRVHGGASRRTHVRRHRQNLHSKKRLGVYTHVISDWVIDLVESSAVSLERGRISGGMVTTSYCYGTRSCTITWTATRSSSSTP